MWFNMKITIEARRNSKALHSFVIFTKDGGQIPKIFLSNSRNYYLFQLNASYSEEKFNEIKDKAKNMLVNNSETKGLDKLTTDEFVKEVKSLVKKEGYHG